LAQELGFNKSKLIYYASLGFLKPVDAMIGKTMIFEKQRIIKIINLIIRHQKDGKSLDEIKFLIK
jgi:DNA-binding transcriptional MerR regulator